MSTKRKKTDPTGDNVALVLSGGGALGAFEAGVLLYVLDTLAKELDRPPRFNIFAGTSIGALNASFLAANAKNPSLGAKRLVEFWKSASYENIVRFRTKELTHFLRYGLSQKSKSKSYKKRVKKKGSTPHEPISGIFDTSPLHEKTRGEIPWKSLRDNLADSTVRGIALCATEVCTSRSVIFYQTTEGMEYRYGQDPSRLAKKVEIGPEHTLASAAMPFFFPAVQIDGTCYNDGGLRQNTPLKPALRMGADRVLVISLRMDPEKTSQLARAGCGRNQQPGALFLLGRTLDAFLTQSLDYELSGVEMYNKLIKGGREIYGDGFKKNLNRIIGGHRNANFRTVRTCHIRPSKDIQNLAIKAIQDNPEELSFSGPAGRLAKKLLELTQQTESDLLSFLMFTPTFINRLIDLGYSNARANKQKLKRLFAD